jgi:uncharacterized protein (TIGR00162 family)
MIESIIIEKKKPKKLRNAVLITGLYLVEELKTEKIANLVSPHFPHQVFMTKKGGLRIIKNSFYLYHGKKRDLIILLGDIQAMSSPGQYEVAGKIVDYCNKLGVKEIITVGGYSTGQLAEKRNIFGVATSPQLRSKFGKLKVKFGEAKGSIVGAAGLLPAIGKINNIDGACIMGETHGSYVDTGAAKQIVILLSKYLGIPVNIKKLEIRAKESQKILKKVQEEVQRTMEQQAEAATQSVTYIR